MGQNEAGNKKRWVSLKFWGLGRHTLGILPRKPAENKGTQGVTTYPLEVVTPVTRKRVDILDEHAKFYEFREG